MTSTDKIYPTTANMSSNSNVIANAMNGPLIRLVKPYAVNGESMELNEECLLNLNAHDFYNYQKVTVTS
jgi:hypothetical protein